MFIYCSSLILKLRGETGIRTPDTPFRGIHAFQACLFNHSSISPINICSEIGCKLQKNANRERFQLQMYSFFVLPRYSQSFIRKKISKLINFKIFGTLFEHSKHF